jgi:acyl-CoA thioester hydrolase
MQRIHIELPEQFHFTTTIPVRVGDLNYGNHLGNDAVLALVHEARMQFLHHHGWSETDLAGVALIMADAGIVYKSEGFYGDPIEVHIAVANLSRAGFDLVYRMVNGTTGKDLALVKTGMLCFDYATRKVRSLPDAFRQQFENL